MTTKDRKTAGRKPARKQSGVHAEGLFSDCDMPQERVTDDGRPGDQVSSQSAMVLANRREASGPTMTSREIAELTGKDHKNVLPDIRLMLEGLGLSWADFSAQYKDASGRMLPMFKLPKRETLILVSGYSVAMRAKIIDRWQELESRLTAPVPAVPQTLAQALRLAADQAEQIERQKEQIEIAAPKVAFVSQYVESSGSFGFRQVAKLLGVKENWFSAFLKDRKIMSRLGGRLMPYAPHLNAGRFEIKTGVNQKTGSGFTEAKFTTKGVEWVEGLIASDRAHIAATEMARCAR